MRSLPAFVRSNIRFEAGQRRPAFPRDSSGNALFGEGSLSLPLALFRRNSFLELFADCFAFAPALLGPVASDSREAKFQAGVAFAVSMLHRGERAVEIGTCDAAVYVPPQRMRQVYGHLRLRHASCSLLGGATVGRADGRDVSGAFERRLACISGADSRRCAFGYFIPSRPPGSGRRSVGLFLCKRYAGGEGSKCAAKWFSSSSKYNVEQHLPRKSRLFFVL